MPLPSALYNAIKKLLPGNRLLTDPADTWSYGYDNSKLQHNPDAVCFPENSDEIQQLVKLCNQHKVFLTARGLASGTTAAAVPLQGGVVLALERMNRIIKIDPANRLAIVQPGVTNQQLQQAAGEQGFFWPPDPTSSAYCTVGGNLACNAAGPRAVKYGTPRDNILGLSAVTGAGELLNTGVQTTKGVVGYDFTRLLVGSEGTLAIITQATLKLTPLPQAKCTLRAVYADMTAAAAAVSRIMAQPVTPCGLEFIDGAAINIIRQYATTDLPEKAAAMLLIEVDGLEKQLKDSAAAISQAATNTGLLELRTSKTEQETAALWAARKALSPALRKIAPKKINEDVVVPVSHMAELIGGLEALSKKYAITIVNFGHAGNGNIHVNLLVNPDDPAELKNAEHCLQAVFDLVLKLNGTLSGEHGIGFVKKEFVGQEIEPTTLELMRRVKDQFDPNGILNPGKFFPEK